MTTFYARLGDIGVELTVILRDDEGPVDLTNGTVTFNAYRSGSTTPTITGTATKANQSTDPGQVTYTLTEANLESPTTADPYDVVWSVAWQDGSIDTFPRPQRDVLSIAS